MKLSQLNEDARFNVSKDGLQVYLDPQAKVFKIIKDAQTKDLYARGLVFTIKTKADYDKLAAKYKVEAAWDEWVEISNKSKEVNADRDFRKALAAMQQDVLKNAKD